jgi:hypothetical protein
VKAFASSRFPQPLAQANEFLLRILALKRRDCGGKLQSVGGSQRVHS